MGRYFLESISICMLSVFPIRTLRLKDGRQVSGIVKQNSGAWLMRQQEACLVDQQEVQQRSQQSLMPMACWRVLE